MDESEDRLGYDRRIELLEQFHSDILRWFDGKYEPEGREELRKRINRNVLAARQATIDAGAFRRVSVGPPPAIGGMVVQNADPFDNLFVSHWGMSMIPMLADMVATAIGAYEHLRDDSGLLRVRTPEVVDLETAIERGLRPSFRRGPPDSERDVQDALQNILNALAVAHVRDKEVATVGPRASRPDFTVESLELAIEVKLATDTHHQGRVQEEINADVSAYGTKWRHLLFVIYDLGVIDDPYDMRQENLKHYGVSVLVIKH